MSQTADVRSEASKPNSDNLSSQNIERRVSGPTSHNHTHNFAYKSFAWKYEDIHQIIDQYLK